MEEYQTFFDFCFLRDHPGGESVPVLVGREKRTELMFAHVVPFKGGGDDWLVGHLLRDLRKMGVHRKVILKSDQGNAILDVLNSVCKPRGKERLSSDPCRVKTKGTISFELYCRTSIARS